MNRKTFDLAVREHKRLADRLLDSGFQKEFAAAVSALRNALGRGNKILICGNGGSAADSQHFAAEMVGRFLVERKGFPAVALTTDSSILTSVSNDYSFDSVFGRQVEALGAAGDVLVAFSTSGKAGNVIEAVRVAKKKHLTVLGLTGKTPNPLARLSDMVLAIPSSSTPRIQEMHVFLVHLLCLFAEQE